VRMPETYHVFIATEMDSQVHSHKAFLVGYIISEAYTFSKFLVGFQNFLRICCKFINVEICQYKMW
jgi:hypothetical protein